jgi:hypothetical protein
MEIEDERAGLPHPARLVDYCGVVYVCDTCRPYNGADSPLGG